MPDDQPVTVENVLIADAFTRLDEYRAKRVPAVLLDHYTTELDRAEHDTKRARYEPRHAYDKRDTTVSIIDLGIGDPFRVRVSVTT